MRGGDKSYTEYLNAELLQALLRISPPAALICLAFVPFHITFRPEAVRWEMAALSTLAGLQALLFALVIWLRPTRFLVQYGGLALVISLIGLTALNAAMGREPTAVIYVGLIVLVSSSVLVFPWQMISVVAFALICLVWLWSGGPHDRPAFEMNVAVVVEVASGLICFRARRKALGNYYEKRRSELKARIQYERAVSGADSALWEYDPARGVLLLASRWADMLGYQRRDLTGKLEDWTSRIHPEDQSVVIANLEQQLTADSPPLSVEHRLRCADGSYRWVLVSGRASPDLEGRIRVAGAFLDIQERKELEEELRYEAQYDRLTGLANRRLLLKAMERVWESHAGQPDRFLAVVFFDLDGFKGINDIYGHAAGDKILMETAKRLKRSFRTQDLVARFGGDEFVVFVDGVSSRSDVEAAAQRARRQIELPVEVERGVFARTGVSCGIAGSWDSHASMESMIKSADVGMYGQKRNKGSHTTPLELSTPTKPIRTGRTQAR